MTIARGGSVVATAHRDRIVSQISAALTRNGLDHATLYGGDPTPSAPLVAAMVQTLAKRAPFMPAPRLLIVDEGHHATAATYRTIFDAWPGCYVLIVTATPERLDGTGLDDIADVMVEGPHTRDLIAAGHLARFDYYAPPPVADLSALRTVAGDYVPAAMSERMNRPAVTGDAIEHYRDRLNGRPAIAFCCDIRHAETVADEFRAAGYRSAAVYGGMRDADARIDALASGEIQVLTSVDLISEGVDVPVCQGVIMLRRTLSGTLQRQMEGRALRPKPDGSRAVFLDHVNNVEQHFLPDTPRVYSLQGRPKRTGETYPIRTCARCFKTFEAAAAAACDLGLPDCPLLTPAPRERIIERRGGRLERVVDPLAWAEGIDIATARGAAWERLLTLAGPDADRMRQIQRLRKYKQNWHKHMLHQRYPEQFAKPEPWLGHPVRRRA
jgi:superfamily II DNA or RNA helicase